VPLKQVVRTQGVAMKVFLGDKIHSHDFGSGTIVAMTPQWCIFKSDDGVEFAVPWDDTYIDVDSPCETHSANSYHEIF
jgi:hypothetical protein